MTRILLDTHIWAWATVARWNLSMPAMTAIAEADKVVLSPVSLYEVGQKVRVGKWPQMVPVLDRIWAVLDEQMTELAPLTAEICLAASVADWDHRDPFDRVIVATAKAFDLALVSADRALANAPGIRTIW